MYSTVHRHNDQALTFAADGSYMKVVFFDGESSGPDVNPDLDYSAIETYLSDIKKVLSNDEKKALIILTETHECVARIFRNMRDFSETTGPTTFIFDFEHGKITTIRGGKSFTAKLSKDELREEKEAVVCKFTNRTPEH